MTNKVTLVGIKQAKRGFKFVHLGPSELCDNCPLYNTCMGNLEKGRVYEVIEVRNIKHSCSLHEEGVMVVEVQEAEIEAIIDKKAAFEGAIITFHFQECSENNCKFLKLCFPLGLKDGDKCKIKEIKDKKIECKLGKKLALVRLKRMES